MKGPKIYKNKIFQSLVWFEDEKKKRRDAHCVFVKWNIVSDILSKFCWITSDKYKL